MKYSKKLTFFFLLFPFLTFAQKGKDGIKNITNADSIVNVYTNLTTKANAGATTIKVGNGSIVQTGDLVMIIQVQGAIIQAGRVIPDPAGGPEAPAPGLNPEDWGKVLNLQNTGKYELREVASVSGNTITLTCPLQNTYDFQYTSKCSSNPGDRNLSGTCNFTAKVEIVKVPRYQSLTINAGQKITSPSWNGTTGGIIALEVNGDIKLDGNIDASFKGFRGGAAQPARGAGDNVLWFWTNNNVSGGEKGEGIAGYQADYDLYGGRWSRGAPANGGGGGNGHNCGGGGGANAGDLSLYDGLGTPDTSITDWIQAWELEAKGFSKHYSSGGGRGGYGWSNKEQNALLIGPGLSSWGGESRQNRGGRGGRPLDYNNTGRIYMGGGGGAGDADNGWGKPGGNGGGIVYIVCNGQITGAGKILSEGQKAAPVDGISLFGSHDCCTDAGSGGGSGGTIIVNALNNVSGITISVRGGDGGDQKYRDPNIQPEAEGPGGGGSGGFVSVSDASLTGNIFGGNGGITTSTAMTEFKVNGGTKGAVGFSIKATIEVSDVEICADTLTTLTAKIIGAAPTGTKIGWYDAQSSTDTLATGKFTTPILYSKKTYWVGAYTDDCGTPFYIKRVSMNVNVKNCKKDTSSVKAPNVFTPNNDGVNDKFKVEHSGTFDNFSIVIFNRWGRKVYEAKDISFEWDGKDCDDGVYYYVINAKGSDGKDYNAKGNKGMRGTLTILR